MNTGFKITLAYVAVVVAVSVTGVLNANGIVEIRRICILTVLFFLSFMLGRFTAHLDNKE